MQHLVYIFHGRFPSEKAAGLFTHKSAESFAAVGLGVKVLAPRRLGRGAPQASSYHTVYVPTLDVFAIPLVRHLAYRVSYVSFALTSLVWLLRHARRDTILVSNEALPLLLAGYFFSNTLYEVHDFPEQNLWMYRALFRRVRFVLATNSWKADELRQRFGLGAHKLILERNGVNAEAFAPRDKHEARRTLSLPQDVPIALYTGHLYAYKGVDTLAAAARSLPHVEVYVVGGTPADVAAYQARHAAIPNLHIVGHVPHDVVPLWQSAADVLVLPNSAKDALSSRYTSPMKLFEYMASERPIVASRVPSIEEVVSDASAYLVEPDNPAALAEGIQDALRDSSRAHAARELVLEYTWDKRAGRILAHFV